MNVPEILDPRKPQGRALYSALIVVAIGLGAFGLGRLSTRIGSQTGVSIVGARISADALLRAQEFTASSTNKETGATAGGVVASKSGSKYFLPWCGGAQTIKEENKIWFASPKEARAAGYEPAGNCKGVQ